MSEEHYHRLILFLIHFINLCLLIDVFTLYAIIDLIRLQYAILFSVICFFSLFSFLCFFPIFLWVASTLLEFHFVVSIVLSLYKYSFLIVVS